MAKTKKKFVITRRFNVWVDKTIFADDFLHAVELAKKSTFADFGEFHDDVDFIDSEVMPGTGVREDW